MMSIASEFDLRSFDASGLLSAFLPAIVKLPDLSLINLKEAIKANKVLKTDHCKLQRTTLDDSQQEAVKLMLQCLPSDEEVDAADLSTLLRHCVKLVVGAPGTGKSAVVAAAAQMLFEPFAIQREATNQLYEKEKEDLNATIKAVYKGETKNISRSMLSAMKQDFNSKWTETTIKACEALYIIAKNNQAVFNIYNAFIKKGVEDMTVIKGVMYYSFHRDESDCLEEIGVDIRDLDRKLKAGKVSPIILCSVAAFHALNESFLKAVIPSIMIIEEVSTLDCFSMPSILNKAAVMPKLARIICVGDDHQLPPFKADVEGAITSALRRVLDSTIPFEMATLKVSYRLPADTTDFLAREVYGLDKYLPSEAKRMISQPFARFIDAANGIWVEGCPRYMIDKCKDYQVDIACKVAIQYCKEKKSVAIICMYDDDRSKCIVTCRLKHQGGKFPISTIDACQAIECDYIVVVLGTSHTKFVKSRGRQLMAMTRNKKFCDIIISASHFDNQMRGTLLHTYSQLPGVSRIRAFEVFEEDDVPEEGGTDLGNDGTVGLKRFAIDDEDHNSNKRRSIEGLNQASSVPSSSKQTLDEADASIVATTSTAATDGQVNDLVSPPSPTPSQLNEVTDATSSSFPMD